MSLLWPRLITVSDGLMKDEGWLWSVELSMGISQLDDDHKALFKLFHEAYQLSQQKPNDGVLYCLASDLLLYTESHLKREEAIMSASSYPDCEEHFEAHRQLVQELKQQFLLIESNNQSALQFVVFLRDSFIDHIRHSDVNIAKNITGYEDKVEQALIDAGPLAIENTNHIYIVDDDEAYVTLMQTMVEMAGYECRIYNSGHAFLESPVSDHDLVVLDLNMPGKDGIEVMRELTEKQLKPSFILISGFDDRVLHSAKQFAESKKLAVIDTLTKPVEVEDFVDVVVGAYAKCRLAYLFKEESNRVNVRNEASNLIDKLNVDVSVDELRQGIKQRELIIYIQPQVHFSNGGLAGGEVLVRWQNPTRGLVFPDQFIPLAEHHHLMTELTRAVILESIKAYKQLRQAGINTTLSINLSAQNITDLSLPEKLDELLSAHDIKPEAFTLELTESAMLTDTSAALDIFNRLRMKGFSLSIDDFGTGDSSLKKLFQSPFSELKIDQHFVRRIENDPDAISIVKVCSLLAKEFKMHTVAEGVETQHNWDKLKSLDCDIAQGYFIAKPMPVKDFIQWAIDRHS